MKNYKTFIPLLFGCLCFSWFYSSCISEINFDLDGEELIVVSGVITNSTDEQFVLVTQTSSFIQNIDTLLVTGTVYKDGEPLMDMERDNFNRLVMPPGFTLEVGSSYHVEITTPDNEILRSRPQVVQPKLGVDTMFFRIEERFDGYNINDQPINNQYVVAYAQVSVPDSIDGPLYYRWTADESWSFFEVPDPGMPNRLDHVCYLTADIDEHPSTILTTRNLKSNSIAVEVARRVLDPSFLYRHYFNANAHSIDSTAYEYYAKADRLISNAGTLYDEVPALLTGNVYKVDKEDEQVMGYVEFSIVNTSRLRIENFEIGINQFNQCMTRNPCNPPIGTPGDTTTWYCMCYDCAHVFGFETLNKPSYWE
ncbi:MAG: DUF4249 family protein [Bacteroidota bacterium]